MSSLLTLSKTVAHNWKSRLKETTLDLYEQKLRTKTVWPISKRVRQIGGCRMKWCLQNVSSSTEFEYYNSVQVPQTVWDLCFDIKTLTRDQKTYSLRTENHWWQVNGGTDKSLQYQVKNNVCSPGSKTSMVPIFCSAYSLLPDLSPEHEFRKRGCKTLSQRCIWSHHSF